MYFHTFDAIHQERRQKKEQKEEAENFLKKQEELVRSCQD